MDIKLTWTADPDIPLHPETQRDITGARPHAGPGHPGSTRGGVRPMHLQFVNLRSATADLIIPRGRV